MPQKNRWTRVTIDLDVATSTVSVFFDDEPAVDAEATFTSAAADPTFRIGAVYMNGPADAFAARFDDVVFDF